MNPTDILTYNVQKTRTELSFAQANIKSVQQWAKNLSELPLGQTSLQLWQGVLELRELECSEILRFELLQCLEPTVRYLLNDLYLIVAQYRHMQHNMLNQQILQLMFGTYALIMGSCHHIAQVIDEKLHYNRIPNWRVFTRFRLKTALIKACFLGLNMSSYLNYYRILFDMPALVNQWYITHQIYYLARKNHQHQVNVDIFIKHVREGYQVRNIEHQYKQILLFELLAAVHLSENDLKILLGYSYSWASYLDFYAIDDKQDASHKIAFHQDLPMFLYYQNKHRFILADIGVDSRKLIEFLNERVVSMQSFVGSETLQLYIHHVLTKGYQRQDERVDFHAQLNTYIGMSDILKVLTQSGIRRDHVARHNTHNYTVNVLDKSSNGYKIQWKDDIPLLLQKGNALLLKEINTGNVQSWQMAIIRWMQRVEENMVELGVEVLSRQQIVVQLFARGKALEEAILGYQLKSRMSDSYFLVLPKNSQIQVGEIVQMQVGGHYLKIQVGFNQTAESPYLMKHDIKLQKLQDSDMLYAILNQSTLIQPTVS